MLQWIRAGGRLGPELCLTTANRGYTMIDKGFTFILERNGRVMQMSNQTTENRTAALLIRRIIAILLTAAALFGMFLPMLTIGSDAQSAFRRVKTEESRSCKAFIEDLPSTVARLMKEEEAEKKNIRTMEDLVADLVNGVALPLYETGEDHQFTFLEVCDIAGRPARAVDILSAYEDDLDVALKDFGNSDPEYQKQEQELRDALADVKPVGSLSKIGSLALYALFGLTLMLGVLSIFMALFNRSKVFHVLFCIFALLIAALFVTAVVGPRLVAEDIPTFTFELGSESVGTALSKLANASVLAATTLLPGIGLCLLSLGALIACILYKRDRSYAGILPKRAKKEAAPAAPRRAKQPAVPQKRRPAYVPPVQAENWTCDSCGQPNDMDAKFCCYCGAKKPQPQTPAPASAARRCPACGQALTSNHQFCPRCGTRIQPEEEPIE